PLFSHILPHPPQSTLFPYTTLFRSSINCQSESSIHIWITATFFSSSIYFFCMAHKDFTPLRILCTFSSFNITPFGMTCHGTFSLDRKSTRLNSSHVSISYAVFCLKK